MSDRLAEVRRLRGEGLSLDEAFAESRRAHPPPVEERMTTEEAKSVIADLPNIIAAKTANGLSPYDEMQIRHLAETITLWTEENE